MPELFADRVVQVLRDEANRDRIGARARSAVKTRFNVVKQVQALELVYSEVARRATRTL